MYIPHWYTIIYLGSITQMREKLFIIRRVIYFSLYLFSETDVSRHTVPSKLCEIKRVRKPVST